MNILSIGNSFSDDAQRYLHDIARADGVELSCYNLFIGGCPLSLHYRNMLSEERAYMLQMNGTSTGFYVSIKEALLNRDWDVITIQQASMKSVDYDSYQPYLDKLCEYIRKLSPKAKLAIHQTWSYEQDSKMLCDDLGYTDQMDMFSDLKSAYKKAYDDVKADILLPSGEVLEELILNGINNIHRDTFHLSLGIGRYTVGLLWYAIFSGNEIEENSFCDFDEPILKEDIETAKKCVKKILNK